MTVPLRWRPVTGSTMDDAREWGDRFESHGAPPDAFVCAAGHQVAGRGRRGSVWDDRPGAALLLTLAIRRGGRCDPADRVPGTLALRAAAAVATWAEDGTGRPMAIKWPNDVLEGAPAAKIAGILAEADARWLRLGIGINLVPTAASSDADAHPRGALWRDKAPGAPALVEPFALDVLARLSRGTWRIDVAERLVWVGELVQCGAAAGRFQGIDDDGAALLIDADGGLLRLFDGPMRKKTVDR